MRRGGPWAVLGALTAATAGAAIWSVSTAPTMSLSPVPAITSTGSATGTNPGSSAYASSLTIDGVTLISISAAQRAGCQRAADQLSIPVPCPGMIPDPIAAGDRAADCASPGLDSCSRPSIGITRPYFIWNQYSFQVPASYVGVPGEISAGGGPLGHFIIYAGRELDTRRTPGPVQPVPSYCAAVRGAQRTAVHGAPATLYSCAETSNGRSVELDVGHELLVWREAGVTCEVSLHGHSRVNDLLDALIARSTVMTYPRR